MKKLWLLLLLLTLAAALLAGCAGNADTLASPSPGVTNMLPDTSPSAPVDPMGSPAPDALTPGGGIATLEDAKKASETMEDAIGQLSEVDDAYVIALDQTALVGVKLNSQYQGGVDERMKKMVLSRVQTVEKAVTGVAVTADEAQVKEIQALAETLDSASALEDVKSQAQKLIDQITVYQE